MTAAVVVVTSIGRRVQAGVEGEVVDHPPLLAACPRRPVLAVGDPSEQVLRARGLR
jgi:hypothetical protein